MVGTVHEYVQEYGVSDETIEIIIGKMAKMLYERPQYYGFSGTDELSEIFAKYWTRINKAVKNYKYRGARFETYFIKTLQFLRINCSRTKLKIFNYDQSIITDLMQEPNIYVFEQSGVSENFRNTIMILKNAVSKKYVRNSQAMKSRIEMLCLKCGLYIDQREIKIICKIADIPEEKLTHLIMLAQIKFSHKRLQYEKLKEHRNALWLRLMNLEIKMSEESDLYVKNSLAFKSDKTRNSYHNIVKKVQNFKLELSNSEIASLLEIPKPTVDSGLLRLQKQLKKNNYCIKN